MTATSGSKLVSATIQHVWQETPTVKGLQLAVDATGSLSFQPGQWVDFHAPGVLHVGGYSICSTPAELQRSGTFDLCVKASRHPCAQWVHSSQAVPGMKVGVQVGGTFTLAPSSVHRPALFVAGGIGITCLSSMLGHLVDLEGRQQPLLLIYSAASPQEFALLPRLLAWQQSGKLRLQLRTTQAHGLGQHLQQQPGAAQLQEGRIDAAGLAAALQQDLHAGPQDVHACVCGPPQMTDSVVEWLQQLGVPPGNVRTEKWW